MGMLKSLFTWWDGATIGTSLWSARHGALVGEDSSENRYFESKKGARRRWVIYKGGNDASRVPAEWHSWLHQTVDEAPADSPVPARSWETEYVANLTGSRGAYRPAGALERGAHRARATGDYEAWSPE